MPNDAKPLPKAMTMERFNELWDATTVDLRTQDFFISRMAALDNYYHADHVNWPGMCWGLSAMARDYFLIGQFDYFSKLVFIINAIPAHNFAAELEEMLQLGIAEKNQFVLSTYNSIHMLMGRAALYQAPQKYSGIISDPPNYQLIDTWARVTPISQTIDQEGDELPAQPVTSFTADFTKDELMTYLNLLQTHIHKNCSFNILNFSHSIELNYSPASGWKLVDPNKLPFQTFATIEDLAQGLINVFQPDGNNIAFHAALYTTLSNSVEIATQWNELTLTPEWTKIKCITLEKAHWKSGYGASMVKLACQRGDLSVVREWLALAVIHEAIFPTDEELISYLTCAAMYGSVNIVHELLEYRPTINRKYALFAANKHNNFAVISELLKDTTDEKTDEHRSMRP